MDLADALRQAVEESLEGLSLRDLAPAARRLSDRYRKGCGTHPGTLGELDAAAYAASRMPATFGALRHVFREVARAQPDLAPSTLLDVGAGPGTAVWAALDTWPNLKRVVLVEPDARMRTWGMRLFAHRPHTFETLEIEWRQGSAADVGTERFDLVVAGYVMGEIEERSRLEIVDRLWDAAAGVLVLVEPGTPDGFSRLNYLRGHLTARGAHITAPCPHDEACPLPAADWCHFSERIARTRVHRLLKGGEAPFEDEKFSYQAFSRRPVENRQSRILRHPEIRSGYVRLRLCTEDGLKEATVSRRERGRFRIARKSAWGGTFERAGEASDAFGPH